MPDPTDGARLRAVADAQPQFPTILGMRLVSYRRDEVVGEMLVADELGNRNGVLYGGAIMALADSLGGTAASLNLPAGARTTTLESKTNFLRPIPPGQTARAAAAVTQTQLVLTT